MTDLNDLKQRMQGAVNNFQSELKGLRTGRASVNLLDGVQADVYGSMMPLNQVGTVSAPESRMLSVQVWDKSNVAAVEKAIQNAGLGLNPSADGQVVRIPMPDLTEERRAELAKVAGKYAEAARISVRNVRRDGMDGLKKAEKDGDISQDEQHSKGDDIQKLTDGFVAEIDELLKAKEAEIMQV